MALELAFKSGELEAEKGREELKAAGSSCGGTVGQGICSRALFGVDVHPNKGDLSGSQWQGVYGYVSA